MTAHMHHPDWDALNDYADGSMQQNSRADVARHIDTCAACRDTVARIRALLDSATSLPQSVEPPAEAWTAIAAKIDEAKVVHMSGVSRSGQASNAGYDVARRLSRRRWLQTAVAAVLLVIVSSGITAMFMRGASHDEVTATIPGLRVNAALAALPAEVRTVERTYLATVEELVAVLNDPASGLSPQTIRAVERSLAVIDAAIAEARQALVDDPASEVLREMFAKTYQQKVELLRRASAHAGT